MNLRAARSRFVPRLQPGRLGIVYSVCLLAAACGGDDAVIVDMTQPNEGSGSSNGGSGSTAEPGGSNAGSSGESPGDPSLGGGEPGTVEGGGGTEGPAASGRIEVSGEINEDTTWTASNTYVLTDLTYVVGNRTLTIEPGTQILGGGVGSALIVTRGSRLVAEGTAEQPIVFTSNISVGLRDPGDWGGVALLGSAPVNVPEAQLEGIEALQGLGAYGGTDEASDCGRLRYVRIEFAGYEFSTDNELNALTLAGCGTATVVDYVQLHRGSDDGVEVFGGKVDLKHVVMSNIQDDSLDWDFGWTGRAQFLVVRHDADTSDAGFEADNGNPPTEAEPRSEPLIYNATMVGGAGSTSPAMNLRRGTWGVVRNSIITGFPVSAVDIRDAFSVAGTALETPRLSIENSIFFNNGEGGLEHGETEPLDGTDGDDDESFDEDAFLRAEARANRFDVDPGLPDAANVTAPNLVPAADSPALSGAAPTPAEFFDAAAYVGAFEPGGVDWTQGWTAYPEN